MDKMVFKVPRKPDRGNLIHVKADGQLWDLEDETQDTDNTCLCYKEIQPQPRT